jgi:ParB family transcriptional regulator, chromosome partitioning protein
MRKALGRGLEALLPGPGTPSQPGPPQCVPIASISPNPEQPRRHFEPEALAALADSIRRYGLLQPLVVRAVPEGFELIAGERRLRASEAAGLSAVPVVLREAEPQSRLELALVENVQRQDLTALEEAEAYRHLTEEYGLTQEEVAKRVGKSRPSIANALRLLSLPPEVRAQLENGEIAAGHARAVLAIEGTAARVAFAREIADRQLPKAEAERVAADRGKHRRAPKTRGQRVDPNVQAVTDALTRALGTRVRLRKRGRGGVIEIEFYSEPELDRLMSRLAPENPAGGF